MNIGCIFARGGSKGLPNKNLIKLFNKPLIGWAIESAIKSKYIDKLFVSTDSDEIADIARDFGAEVPFKRPKSLASDNSPEIDSWRHFLNYMEKNCKDKIDSLVSVPATSPLRDFNDIDKCVELFYEKNADLVITVTDSYRSPYFNMVSITENQKANLVNKLSKPVFRRQDSPKTFDMCTICFVASPKYVVNCKHQFDGKVFAHKVSRETSIDIDNIEDLNYANYLLSKNKY